MPRILIAIKTCYRYKHRADAQRATWVPDVKGADVKFFLGQAAGYVPRSDEVVLDCSDEYLALPAKTKAICAWALEHGYDFTFGCDDDTYCRPERLLASGFERYDYSGRLRGPSGVWPAPYCSGFAYWLSRRAMQVVVGKPLTADHADDRWLGNVLNEARVAGQLDERYRVTKCDEAKTPGQKGEQPNAETPHLLEDQMVGNAIYAAGGQGHADFRYALIASPNGRNTPSSIEGPRQGNDIIAACEFEPAEMHRIHQQFLSEDAAPLPPMPRGSLSNVCVLIKTFLRDEFLRQTVGGIQQQLPDAKMVIVDDGYDSRQKIQLYGKLRQQGHECIWLERDSGFGAKANAGVEVCDRPYVLIASDDFDFADPEKRNARSDYFSVREGIEKLVAVLDHCPEIGVASGRVDGNPYEFLLELGSDWARQTAGYRGSGEAGGVEFNFTDLTVNYSLIRREVFDKVRWDQPEPKIGGGEHGAFYIDLKRAVIKVAHVPGVNINQLRGQATWQHPDYVKMRRRALSPERPCYTRRGILHYLTSGGCEQCGPACPTVRSLASV